MALNPQIRKLIQDPLTAKFFRTRTLLFTCDKAGIVTWLYSAGSHHYQHMIRKLENRNIRDFYFIPEKKTLWELADPEDYDGGDPLATTGVSYPFNSRNLLENLHESCDFYSNLVFSRLYLRRLSGNDGLLGVIAHIENSSYSLFEYVRHNPIFLIDEKDVVCGYNGSFARQFRKDVSGPEAFLDKPVESLLSDNPRRLYRDRLRGLAAANALDWKLSFSHKMRGPAPGGLFEFNRKDAWQFGQSGWTWKGVDGTDENFMTLLKKIDHHAFDIKVELMLEPARGTLPGCILCGDRYNYTGLFPDFQGYNIGFYPGNTAGFIKKRGYLFGAFKDVPAAGRAVSLSVVKAGREVYLGINDTWSSGVYDEIRDETMGEYASFFLREGSEAVLREVRVFVRNHSEQENEPPVEVSLLSGRENAFYAHMIPTWGLSTGDGQRVEAYLLDDITAFKQRISRLEKEKSLEQEEKERLQDMLDQKREARAFIAGKSRAFAAIKEKTALVSGTRATILIEGETGTGKEVLAQYIHRTSKQRGPFIKVDCASLPATLIESELFGHKKGSFTGAMENKKGKFELAHKGTLFLDEVSNISLEMQAKLLGFLQDFTIQPIGGTKTVKLDLRVICATNQGLADQVKKGLFREDLFYRLNVIRFIVPPLRERREDIPDLAMHFLEESNHEFKKDVRAFMPDAYEKMYAYPWPGNIRELRAVIQKAVLFCRESVIGADLLDIRSTGVLLPAEKPKGEGTPLNIRKITREELEALLEKNGGTIYKTAKELGVTRKTLYDKIKKFGIDIKSLRA